MGHYTISHWYFFWVAILLWGCAGPHVDKSEQSKAEIIQTDLQMSELAVTAGFHHALLMFADDSLVKPEEGRHPIVGKNKLEEHYKHEAGTRGLSWKPFKAEAAASGDLGYSLGNWKFETPDTILYGNYYTIWKRHSDGSWKWVADGGNNTPSPE